RIVHYVTVIATQKLDDKDKQVGIFFDRNRLNTSFSNRKQSVDCHGLFIEGICGVQHWYPRRRCAVR
ncbi:MAG: hypothetical protein BECKG1743F_GA0114225_112531, partial [Candidatus Kentron sp. G]